MCVVVYIARGGGGGGYNAAARLAQSEGQRQIIPIICLNGQKRYKTRLLGR